MKSGKAGAQSANRCERKSFRNADFCQLVSHGRGVDGSPLDQSEEAIEELIQALRQQTQKFPQTVFLATGIQDVLVSQEQVIVLQNGVPELDCFTGTGDLVGALVAALLGEGNALMTRQ